MSRRQGFVFNRGRIATVAGIAGPPPPVTPLTILGSLAWWVRADLGITIGTGVSALNSALPLPDDIIPSLQSGPAQGRLTGPEIAALATAIAGRVTVDLEAGYSPKANSVGAAKASATREDP